MEFGVAYFPTHDGIGPGPLARLVEERGQDALFFAEHTHIPAGRETPYPGGGDLPRRYYHTYDLFIALTAAAVATTRLRVGSGICLVIERDPIVTAKEVASVDHLSGGRLEFGVGIGWNREEMRNHGTDPATRVHLARERVEAMKAIWTSDEATYHGDYVSFERIWSWPKPAQRPHPPVLVGGEGPTVEARVLAYGDGWLPQYRPSDDTFGRIEQFRAKADRPLDVQLFSVPADPTVLERARAAGVSRVVRWLPAGPRGPVERGLDRWEQAIYELNGG
jgi:probable F420-dependent oxidoreductase